MRKTVAVVTPVSASTFRPAQELALRHLERHLGAYDRYFYCRESLDVSRPGYRVRRFPDRYFGTVRAYSALMLSPAFYRAFAEYEYVLIYHLDALVFSDQLLAWCAKGYDYIGAPWTCGDWTPGQTPAVGNGGFCLRKVASCLRVLESPVLRRTYWVDPEAYWARYSAGLSPLGRLLNSPRRYLKRLHVFNNVRRTLAGAYRGPNQVGEDIWWAHEAVRLDPGFTVAPAAEAMRFAFEEQPRWCFEAVGRVLPFGCHAWERHDPAFWAPYLEAPLSEVEPFVSARPAAAVPLAMPAPVPVLRTA